MVHRRKQVTVAQGRVLAGVFLVVMALAYGWTVVAAQGGDRAYDEAEAQAIDQMLMCPVCPGQNIDQSQAELARQMRQIVREMLAGGKSREEILGFFVERYGPSVLAAPPKTGFSLIAWIFPPVVVVAGLTAAWLVLRSMAARRRVELDGVGVLPRKDEPPLLEAGLEPYLEVVDQELDMQGRAAAPGRPHSDQSIRQAHDQSDSNQRSLRPLEEGDPRNNG